MNFENGAVFIVERINASSVISRCFDYSRDIAISRAFVADRGLMCRENAPYICRYIRIYRALPIIPG